MYAVLPAILLGAAAASAKPVAWGGEQSGSHGGAPSSYHHNNGSSSQEPFKFPLSNGFPDVSADVLRDIEEAAHGTLPNGDLPSEINDTSATVFELIAFNEMFEVAFFTSLLDNITENVDGFQIESRVLRNFVIDTITAVQAQEELHFLGANGILNASGHNTIEPCEYVFPTDKFDDAINLARTFTDVVLGTLQDALVAFAGDGDGEKFSALIGSVIGQEGEQNGYYRSLLGLIPSGAPFLTRSAAPFAFSALNQMFVVPGTCPGAGNAELFKALPVFGALTVDTKNIQLKDQTLTFSVTSNSTGSDFKDYSVVYLNQQNVPLVEKIENVKIDGDYVTFDAFFPAATLIMDDLTIAAVTKNAGPFASADEVAAATLYGPGLIEIN